MMTASASFRGSVASALNFRKVQPEGRQFWDPIRVAEARRNSIGALVNGLLPNTSALQGAAALDLGCGEGGGVLALRDAGAASVLGLDLDAAAIKAAQQVTAGDPACVCRLGDGAGVGEPDGSFDFVLCCEILEHVASPREFLAEVSRVLRPGGLAVITFPSFASITGPHLWHLVNIPFGQHLLGLDAIREEAGRQIQAAGRSFDGTWDPLNGITIRSFRRILKEMPELSLEVLRVYSRFPPLKPFSKFALLDDLAGDSVRSVLRKR